MQPLASGHSSGSSRQGVRQPLSSHQQGAPAAAQQGSGATQPQDAAAAPQHGAVAAPHGWERATVWRAAEFGPMQLMWAALRAAECNGGELPPVGPVPRVPGTQVVVDFDLGEAAAGAPSVSLSAAYRQLCNTFPGAIREVDPCPRGAGKLRLAPRPGPAGARMADALLQPGRWSFTCGTDIVQARTYAAGGAAPAATVRVDLIGLPFNYATPDVLAAVLRAAGYDCGVWGAGLYGIPYGADYPDAMRLEKYVGFVYCPADDIFLRHLPASFTVPYSGNHHEVRVVVAGAPDCPMSPSWQQRRRGDVWAPARDEVMGLSAAAGAAAAVAAAGRFSAGREALGVGGYRGPAPASGSGASGPVGSGVQEEGLDRPYGAVRPPAGLYGGQGSGEGVPAAPVRVGLGSASVSLPVGRPSAAGSPAGGPPAPLSALPVPVGASSSQPSAARSHAPGHRPPGATAPPLAEGAGPAAAGSGGNTVDDTPMPEAAAAANDVDPDTAMADVTAGPAEAGGAAVGTPPAAGGAVAPGVPAVAAARSVAGVRLTPLHAAGGPSGEGSDGASESDEEEQPPLAGDSQRGVGPVERALEALAATPAHPATARHQQLMKRVQQHKRRASNPVTRKAGLGCTAARALAAGRHNGPLVFVPPLTPAPLQVSPTADPSPSVAAATPAAAASTAAASQQLPSPAFGAAGRYPGRQRSSAAVRPFWAGVGVASGADSGGDNGGGGSSSRPVAPPSMAPPPSGSSSGPGGRP